MQGSTPESAPKLSRDGVAFTKASTETASETAGGQEPRRVEVRCAVRFPLSLPVVIFAPDGAITAETVNVSASGVLLRISRKMAPGEAIQFQMRMPGQVFGAQTDVVIDCNGRVVRCHENQDKYLTAATIDEYRFAEN